eukprot:795087_1
MNILSILTSPKFLGIAICVLISLVLWNKWNKRNAIATVHQSKPKHYGSKFTQGIFNQTYSSKLEETKAISIYYRNAIASVHQSKPKHYGSKFTQGIFNQTYSSKLEETKAISIYYRNAIASVHQSKPKHYGSKFTQGIFNQTYSSKLEEIDKVNRIAKLSIPSPLFDVYENEFKPKEEKSMTPSSPCPKHICFAFSHCKGFYPTKLNKNCVLEYKIKKNEKYDVRVPEGGVFPFKAVGVHIPMLDYRWERSTNGKWVSVSRQSSIKWEETYNKDHKEMQRILTLDDGTVVRRITTFKGKVLKVDKASKRGQVQINYREEYGKKIGIWFNFRDCGFKPNYLKLKPGDLVEYRVRGNNAVRVFLWLIPYKWIYKVDNNNWKEFSYHESIQIEKKYNPRGDDKGKPIQITHNNAKATARRSTVFRSSVMFDKRKRKQSWLAVRYGDCNLGIRVPYTVRSADRFRHNDCVSFQVKRDDKMRRWTAHNVKKVKFETKEKRMLEQNLRNLKEKAQRMQKKYEELKEDINTVTEYKWKWKDSDGSYYLYKPDISNKLNGLPIDSIFRLPRKKWSYVVKKVSEDSAVQVNQHTSTTREVKRFMIRTPKAKHVAQRRPEISIPDGLYYQNDYHTLNDAEIEQKFYSTVGICKIHEIEDVVVESKKHQYEVNLWNKCRQLKRSRDKVEKYLWHGASFDILNVIIQNGFDRCYSTTAVYGSGTYFARDASYSVKDRYTPPHSDGYKYMLLCKVIVGDSMLGSSSITKVPKKADGSEYDTLVDTLSNTSIYVAWRDYYAIPLFRIKFKAISIY